MKTKRRRSHAASCLFSSTYKLRDENKGRRAGKVPALCGKCGLPWSYLNAKVRSENAEVKPFLLLSSHFCILTSSFCILTSAFRVALPYFFGCAEGGRIPFRRRYIAAAA
jgi:hypothetical protein